MKLIDSIFLFVLAMFICFIKLQAQSISSTTQAISAEECFNAGFAKFQSGKYAEAIEDFDKSIRLKSDVPSAFVNPGLAKNRLGKYIEAIADYDQAIRLKANEPMAEYHQRNRQDVVAKETHTVLMKNRLILTLPLHVQFRGNAVVIN